MAKKSRRNKRRQVRLSAAQLAQPRGAESAEPLAVVVAAEAPDLRKEYGRVFTDLKRLGIVAAAALVVVIVLVLVLA
ncbi:MAG: hypothetical protein JW918_08245 [Anaerolineae bacterium]|nr:hypothetical protein [Anaerolineae bacterium]